MYVNIDESQHAGLSDEQVDKAVTISLKLTQQFLTKRSIKELGTQMKISPRALKNRILKSKVKGHAASVWFGFMPVPVDKLRKFYQDDGGIVSGDDYYKGAFAQTVNNAYLVWNRWVERQKAGTRKRRNPNGQAVKEQDRRYKSKIERAETAIDEAYQKYVFPIEDEAVRFFTETLNDELFKQRG